MYFPDGTYGAVRTLDTRDIRLCGIKGIVVNTYHLYRNPGINGIKKLGGIHAFMGWNGIVASDSGGFQFLSLFYKNPEMGSVTDRGIRLYSGPKKKQISFFTPKISVDMQFAISSDIMICLDDCPSQKASLKQTATSIKRTIRWAKECKEEFVRQCKNRHYTGINRPLLFAVVQGGNNTKLRAQCAQALVAMDFDGYAFGGWPVKQGGGLDTDILKLVRSFTPKDKPLFALGVGKPDDIVACRKIGYDIFDCVLPTRDARHGRIYIIRGKKTSYIDIEKGVYKNDKRPLDSHCRCLACQNCSRAYLHHLFKMKEIGGFRLATIHNLTAYADLAARLQSKH